MAHREIKVRSLLSRGSEVFCYHLEVRLIIGAKMPVTFQKTGGTFL